MAAKEDRVLDSIIHSLSGTIEAGSVPPILEKKCRPRSGQISADDPRIQALRKEWKEEINRTGQTLQKVYEARQKPQKDGRIPISPGFASLWRLLASNQQKHFTPALFLAGKEYLDYLKDCPTSSFRSKRLDRLKEITPPPEIRNLRRNWCDATSGQRIGLAQAFAVALRNAREDGVIPYNQTVTLKEVIEILKGPIKSWTGEKDWALPKFVNAQIVAEYCIKHAQEQGIRKKGPTALLAELAA